jgi:hypothetical protein
MSWLEAMRESWLYKALADIHLVHWLISILPSGTFAVLATRAARMRGLSLDRALFLGFGVAVLCLVAIHLALSLLSKLKSRKTRRTSSDVLKKRPLPKEFEYSPEQERMRTLAGIEPKPIPEPRPVVLMGWDSGSQPWTEDKIRLRNEGETTALCVRVGEFSWPELLWHRPVEVQFLEPKGPEIVREADFVCTLASGHEVGYMYRVLQSFEESVGRQPLRIPVAFSDSKGNEFTQVFILQRGASGNPSVMVTLGPLRVS